MDELQLRPDLARPVFLEAAASFLDVVGAVGALGPTVWDRPALGVWTVRDLVGHASRALATPVTYLASGAGRTIELDDPFAYFSVLTTGYADHDLIADRGRHAGRELGDDPLAAVTALRDDAARAIAGAGDDDPVASPGGVMRLVDYLPTRTFELTVHTGDLARALGIGFVPGPGPATVTLACLASLAVARGNALDAILAIAGRGPLPDGYSVI